MRAMKSVSKGAAAAGRIALVCAVTTGAAAAASEGSARTHGTSARHEATAFARPHDASSPSAATPFAVCTLLVTCHVTNQEVSQAATSFGAEIRRNYARANPKWWDNGGEGSAIDERWQGRGVLYDVQVGYRGGRAFKPGQTDTVNIQMWTIGHNGKTIGPWLVISLVQSTAAPHNWSVELLDTLKSNPVTIPETSGVDMYGTSRSVSTIPAAQREAFTWVLDEAQRTLRNGAGEPAASAKERFVPTNAGSAEQPDERAERLALARAPGRRS